MDLSVYEKWYKFCPNCRTELVRKLVEGKEYSACPECDFIFWNNPKPVVSILCCVNNKILMLQRANEPLKGWWCLPGGFVNYEETPAEAAAREGREEVGVNVTIGKIIGVYRIDNDPRGVNIDTIYEGTLAENISLSDEHSNFEFFELDNLPENIAYKHREAINDWLKQLEN